MNDNLLTASSVVVLAFAAYPLFLCIRNVMGAYTDHFAPSEWKLDPSKSFSMGRMKTPVLSGLMIVGFLAFIVVGSKTLLMLGVHLALEQGSRPMPQAEPELERS